MKVTLGDIRDQEAEIRYFTDTFGPDHYLTREAGRKLKDMQTALDRKRARRKARRENKRQPKLTLHTPVLEPVKKVYNFAEVLDPQEYLYDFHHEVIAKLKELYPEHTKEFSSIGFKMGYAQTSKARIRGRRPNPQSPYTYTRQINYSVYSIYYSMDHFLEYATVEKLLRGRGRSGINGLRLLVLHELSHLVNHIVDGEFDAHRYGFQKHYKALLDIFTDL